MKKNIGLSIIYRILATIINLLLIPLTIEYLNPDIYGVWLTLTSIVSWIYFFDIGIGNGLRKGLAGTFANDDFKASRKYISTSYAVLIIIGSGIFLIGFIVIPLFNWGNVLNAPDEYSQELILLIFIVFALFCLQLIANTLKMILLADLRSATNDLITLTGSILSLVFILILREYSQGSLLLLGVVFSVSPLLSLVIATLIFFNKKYKSIRPSIKYIDWSISKSLLGDGVKFFVLQIGAVIVFQSSNIIINQLFGPAAVTEFNISYKYFNVALLLFLVILNPVWSAYSDAFVRKDINWMTRTYRKYIHLSALFTFFIIVMLILSPVIIKIWIGDKVHVSFLLSLFVAGYSIASLWMSTFIYIINGIGKISLQVYVAILEILCNIPLSVFLGKKFGMPGVLISMTFFVVLRIIWAPIQVRRLLRYNAKGLWNR